MRRWLRSELGWPARLGGLCYLLWGILHVVAGCTLLVSALGDINGHLAEMSTGGAGAALPRLPEGSVVSAIIAFHSFNMIWVGALVGALAVSALRGDARRRRLAFVGNLVLAGALDVGLVVFVLAPGYLAWRDGLLGPALFLLALGFGALGLRRDVRPAIAACADACGGSGAVTVAPPC